MCSNKDALMLLMRRMFARLRLMSWCSMRVGTAVLELAAWQTQQP
jgi:hypothetical protein